MVMMRSALALSLFLLVSAGAARADDAVPAACTVASTNILSGDQGDVTITCTKLTEAVGEQFALILTRILQDRLDAQMVMAKLDEVDQIPEEGVARTVTEAQRQLILRSLSGKPAGLVAITAHPEAGDGPELAKGIATALLQAGWQIDGQQIRRIALPALELDPWACHCRARQGCAAAAGGATESGAERSAYNGKAAAGSDLGGRCNPSVDRPPPGGRVRRAGKVIGCEDRPSEAGERPATAPWR